MKNSSPLRLGMPISQSCAAVANRLPFQLAEVERLAGVNRDIGLGEFAENAIGDRVKLVRSGANVGDAEAAIGRAADPKLIVFGVVLPGLAAIGGIGIGEADQEVRQRARAPEGPESRVGRRQRRVRLSVRNRRLLTQS